MSEDRINAYIQHFSGKLNDIASLGERDERNEGIHTFQKLLIVSLLDALSKIIYGNNKTNRKRFTGFIARFGDWDDGKRLSIPHLSKALDLDLDPDLEELRLFIRDKWDSWEKGKIIRINQDLTPESIAAKMPRGTERSLAQIPVDHYNHYNLIYEMRNGLIHEFRPLGYGMEFADDKTPYYHTMDHHMDNDPSKYETSWELVYPLKFLQSLASTALVNLGNYLRENELNPDRHFRFGTYFFDIMNPENL